MNFLSCPWSTKYHYHVFWSFDPSFLLNGWSCVMFSFVYKHRYPSDHRGTRWWCGQGTMGWGGSRAVARLLALCLFLKAALPLCGTSPCSSFLWPILCISLVQIPEGTCLNDLSSCHCPYWAEPGLRSC